MLYFTRARVNISGAHVILRRLIRSISLITLELFSDNPRGTAVASLRTDVPLRTHTNLLKQKENFKNVVATKYLFDSIGKTVTNIRR